MEFNVKKTGSAYRTKTICPCCGALDSRVVSTVDGKTGGDLLTLSCDKCGLGRIDPMPSAKQLADWYANEYRQAYKEAVQPALRHVLRAGRNAINRWRWFSDNSPKNYWDSPGAEKMSLDIGASSGEFVMLMKTMGFQASGIEPHIGYSTYANEVLGLSVKHGVLQERLGNEKSGSLDLVTMFHVLEHLTDPVASLQQISGLMKGSGLLYIEVPNATRPCSPRYMFFRAHTLYFTGPSLRQTLEVAGLEVVSSNSDDSDNLCVIARPGFGVARNTFEAHGHELVKAQKNRRWIPYLLDQIISGRPFLKWKSRKEEKRAASQFSSGKELLEHLYRGYSTHMHG